MTIKQAKADPVSDPLPQGNSDFTGAEFPQISTHTGSPVCELQRLPVIFSGSLLFITLNISIDILFFQRMTNVRQSNSLSTSWDLIS